MKNAFALLITLTVIIGLVQYIFVFKHELTLFYGEATNALAGVFFRPSITEVELHKTFAEAATTTRKVRILLVPGHEPTWGGTEYKSAIERDIVVKIGKEIANIFSAESHYQIIVARNELSWQSYLLDYFQTEKENILNWRKLKQEEMNKLVSEGLVRVAPGVLHNNAPDEAVLHLYGINKWASEKDFDIVLHLHINDNPRRNVSLPGEYRGVTIYVPEEQYSNALASKSMADALSKKLFQIVPKSTMPKESVGVVPDQDLIAIGRYNTSDTVSLLIEYGYIYEPMYRTKEMRDFIAKEFAYETTLGLKSFFAKDNNSNKGKYEKERPVVSYIWQNELTDKNYPQTDVLAMQIALSASNLYHLASSATPCPLTGFIGPCTKQALANFQKAVGLFANGNFNEETREIFNRLFGPQGDGVIRQIEAAQNFAF
ncbi:MAG: N-acetylmuramoyl-L-alanine amidase [bacterium]|nr:N-acetylmuramoyl-L-alanine amidase [bacterium]